MSDVLLFSASLAVTVLGLLASWAVYRRRGAGSGARGAAWALVPLGFYLTGLTEFLTELVFSPVKWAGVAVLGLAGVLYVVSGVKLRSSADVPKPQKQTRAAPKRAAVQRPQQAQSGLDDDLGDIEEILKRRGIS